MSSFRENKMGLLSALRREIARALEAAAGSFESAVERTGDRVADRLESAGHAAQDALRAERRDGWSAEFVAGVMDLAAAVTKGGFGMVAGGAAGLLRAVAGIPLVDPRRLLHGSIDVGSSTGGAVILTGGMLVSLIQRLLRFQNVERPLTAEERDLLRRVFGDSVSLHNVRIVEGRCGVFGLSRRPFAMGNTIFFKRIDPRRRRDILVHECVHVWQYRNVGARYIMDALGAQAVLGRSAYDWRAEIRRGARSWAELNREAQAALIQDIWRRNGMVIIDDPSDESRTHAHGAAARTRGGAPASFVAGGAGAGKFVFDGHDYSELARDAIAALRNRGTVPSRRSSTVNSAIDGTPEAHASG